MTADTDPTPMGRSLLLPALVLIPVLIGPPRTSAGPEPSVAEVKRIAAEYRQRHERAILDEFIELLAIPNVAADRVNIRRNAEHIAALLRRRGITTRLLTLGDSPPVVYGELLDPSAAVTVVIYVHYDGQPVDEARWTSEPWSPVLRDKAVELGGRELYLDAGHRVLDPEWRLYARSAGDDKAPIIALVSALDALRQNEVPLSLNLKLFFDGEEEAGSPHLAALLEKYAGALDADLWLFCDGPVHQTRRQQLAFGVRGITEFELTVYGGTRELHSGHYGNWAPNPIMLLSDLLVSMRDTQGNILIEGFLDPVVAPTPAELGAIAAAPRVDAALRNDLALGWTEGGERRVEELILRPALNLRGIRAGQVGDQARNAIPVSATASIGIRLVPDLTPATARLLVEKHIRSQGFHIVAEPPNRRTRLEHPRIARVVWGEHGYPAVRFPMEEPLAQALIGVMEEVADEPVVRLPTMGGSLPLHLIRSRLDVPIILLPIANHDNNQHAPDENLRLQNLWDAIEIYAAILATFGQRMEALVAGQ